MMRARSLLLLLVGLAGCASPFAMSDPHARVAPARLAVLPTNVESFEVDADNHVRALLAEEGLAQQSLDQSLSYGTSVHGARFFQENALSQVEGAREFEAWSTRAIAQIGDELLRAAHGRSTRAGVAAWRYQGDLAPLGEALGADFVLVSSFFDGENSSGRTALNVLTTGFGGKTYSGKREGTACVVDLADGRLIWCARVFTDGYSVRNRSGAQRAVDELLAGLFAPKGPAAP